MAAKMSDWIVWIFSICVQTMVRLAAVSGLSYKEINALIFLLLQPGLIILFAILWGLELRKTARLNAIYKKRLETPL